MPQIHLESDVFAAVTVIDAKAPYFWVITVPFKSQYQYTNFPD